MENIRDPISYNIPERQAFCTAVLADVDKRVKKLVSTSCDALGYHGERERHQLLDRVDGAAQKYVFYLAGINIRKKEVEREFNAIGQGIPSDLAVAVKRHVQNAVEDSADELLRKVRMEHAAKAPYKIKLPLETPVKDGVAFNRDVIPKTEQQVPLIVDEVSAAAEGFTQQQSLTDRLKAAMLTYLLYRTGQSRQTKEDVVDKLDDLVKSIKPPAGSAEPPSQKLLQLGRDEPQTAGDTFALEVVRRTLKVVDDVIEAKLGRGR